MTYVCEALVSGADGSFHPRSGKSPKGLGGIGKVNYSYGILDRRTHGSGMMTS